jgi:hypothetical protein
MSQMKIRRKPDKQKPNDPQTNRPTSRGLYMQAESFFQSGNLLFHNATQVGYNPQLLFPSFVCHAFSLELYLKCLIVMEGNAYPLSHDLEELFRKLTLENQTEVENLCKRHLPLQQKMVDLLHKQSNSSSQPPVVTFQSCFTPAGRPSSPSDTFMKKRAWQPMRVGADSQSFNP